MGSYKQGLNMYLKLILLAMVLPTSISAGPIADPQEADLVLLETTIKQGLRDPESLAMSDTLAAPEPTSQTGATWICGNIRAKNRFGGYEGPAPFLASIRTDPLSGARAVNILKIAGSAEQVRLIGEICEAKFRFATDYSAAETEVQTDLKAYSDRQAMCVLEGGSGTNCSALDGISERLVSNGWCPISGGVVDWERC